MQVEIKAEERNEFSASADIETSRALGEREREKYLYDNAIYIKQHEAVAS